MDDCSCLVPNYDGDQPSFSAQTWRKARKPYVCYECNRPIRIGERYEAYSGKWEKSVTTYHTCAECQNIREALCCSGWTFGQLWEDIEDQIFAGPGLTVACIDKLTDPAAKAYLQHHWMQYVGRNS